MSVPMGDNFVVGKTGFSDCKCSKLKFKQFVQQKKSIKHNLKF